MGSPPPPLAPVPQQAACGADASMMHPHTAVSPHSQRGHREISPWPDGVVCVSHTLSFVRRISSQADSIV